MIAIATRRATVPPIASTKQQRRMTMTNEELKEPDYTLTIIEQEGGFAVREAGQVISNSFNIWAQTAKASPPNGVSPTNRISASPQRLISRDGTARCSKKNRAPKNKIP
jgi:hypothetical protein